MGNGAEEKPNPPAKVHHVFLTKRYILILTTLCTDEPTAP